MNIKVFSSSYLESLISEAMASPRQRQHRNIHIDYADPCQRLFNAIELGSYIRPHRHGTVSLPLPETMVAVRGLMALLIFDEEGSVVQVQRFGAGPYSCIDGVAVGVEIPVGYWHTVVALERGSVLLEVKAGPFNPEMAKDLAPWAPEEGSEAVVAYLSMLRSFAVF